VVSSPSGAFHSPIPTLTDGVVTLRGFRSDDLDAMVETCNDPLIRQWSSLPQPYERKHAEGWLARSEAGWSDGSHYQFGIEHNGRLIGDVNLRPQHARLAEVGFSLAAAARGQGFMTRALRLVLPWGFHHARIDVVHWRAHVGNWASRRVAWAVGFRVDAVVPGLLEQRGNLVDGWLAAITRNGRLQPVHPWYDPEPVIGKTTVLRAHREQDVPRMVEACRDPQTRHWLAGLPDDYSEVHARQHLEQIRAEQAAGRGVQWVVADPDDDRLLADLALFIRDPHDPQGEIGYWTHPDARGRGVITEGVQLVARHALLPEDDGGLGLDRILIRTDAGNLASQRVAEKAGFTFSGRDRHGNLRRDGSRSDHLRFDLLADELPAVR
jgi:RimJ/RimL family protein N-acetyltransferase